MRSEDSIINVVLRWGEDFLGGYDKLVYLLVILIAANIMAGFMCAVAERNANLAVSIKGIFQKILIFVLVGIGNILDEQLLGTQGAMRGSVIVFYISFEGIDFLKKVTRLGLPIPKKMKEVMGQFQDQAEQTVERI